MIYRVRHTTRYAYGGTVNLAVHMLHLRPRPLDRQHVVSAGLAADPQPSRRREGVDHFGNGVTWLFLNRPHPGFEVTAEAVVDVRSPRLPAPGATPPWEGVRDLARLGGPAAWEAAEFVFDSAMAPADPAAGAYAASSFPPGRPVLDGLAELNGRIFRDFRFRSGVTTIATPVREVMQRRQGVCQDFSHVMIAMLRALGLPARYVSGYIRTRPPPGQPRRIGSDVSHAWVGAWLGPDHGWVDLDPTNDLLVDDEHVVLAWGRDYADVSPTRGVILGGGGTHGLTVSVDLEPLEEPA